MEMNDRTGAAIDTLRTCDDACDFLTGLLPIRGGILIRALGCME